MIYKCCAFVGLDNKDEVDYYMCKLILQQTYHAFSF